MEQETDIEILITLIEERPVLWDKTLDVYKDRTKTRAAWKEVCCALKEDFENCNDAEKNEFGKSIITKWNNVRDNFLRSFKKIQQQKTSGAAAKTGRKYIFFDQLLFLKKIYELNKTSSSLDSTITSETPASIDSEERGNGQQPFSNSQSTSKPLIEKISRKRKPDEFERKIIDILEKPKGKGDTMDRNPHMNFFASLLPSLETFNDDETLEFKMDVLNSIKNIKNKRTRLIHTTHTSTEPYRHYQPVSYAQPNVFTSQYSSFEVPRQQPTYLQPNSSTSSTPDTQIQYANATSPQSQFTSPLSVQSLDNSEYELDFTKL